MKEQLYRISDVAAMLNIKSHVIRNWENELGIETPRSDSGYRFYTEDTVSMLKLVKRLKDIGFSLKQIRLLLPNIFSLQNASDKELSILKSRLDSCQIMENVSDKAVRPVSEADSINKEAVSNQSEAGHVDCASSKVTYFPANNVTNTGNELMEEFIKNVIADAFSENIDALSKELSKSVAELVSKEMNYQLIQHENLINDRLKAMEITINNSHSHKKNSYFGLRSKFANLVSSDCHFN